MKLFIRFFLSLCVWLLGHAGLLQAHEQQVHVRYPSHAVVEKAVRSTSLISQSFPESSFRPNVCDADQDNDDFDDATDEDETENDELTRLARQCVNGNYFICSFCSPVSSALTAGGNCRYSFYKHFSYSSSDRYIVFRIIRI